MEPDKNKQSQTDPKALAKSEPTMAERFTQKIIAEFGSTVGEVALTNFQKRLAQNYFIAIDAALKMADEKRIKSNSGKSDKYQNNLPITWANVNLELVARNVVAAARVGLDPAQKNHVNMVPYKNNTTNKYDIGFIPGYRGLELQAKKYGLDVPDHVIVELVHANDRFKSIKKDRNNQIEGYEFEIVDDFNRGEIKGGFYYHVYADHPEKNKLVVFTLKDIEKRKPAYASVEFWGGEKDVYKNGQKTGEKEKVEGWYEAMCWKTIYRAAYSSITIDSQKIDDDYMRLLQMENEVKDAEVAAEIAAHANGEVVDVEFTAASEEKAASTTAQSTALKTEPAEPAKPGPGF
jgi:recombination protein RecT